MALQVRGIYPTWLRFIARARGLRPGCASSCALSQAHHRCTVVSCARSERICDFVPSYRRGPPFAYTYVAQDMYVH